MHPLSSSLRFVGLTCSLLCAGACLSAHAASIQVVLATDQTPGDADVARVSVMGGGVWDRAGRVLMQGRYRSAVPWEPERNAIWAWTGPNTARELYSDGDDVPYYSEPVAGIVPQMSAAIIQPRFGGYVPPPDYWAFRSSVTGRPPEVPESTACWVNLLTRPAPLSPTIFVVNDLESHQDGSVVFVRPSIEGFIVRPVPPGNSNDVTFITPSGAGAQLFVNGSYMHPASGRGGSVVWIARSDLTPVISGRSNVVRLLAASAGMELPSHPGGAYSALRVMGVDAATNLLWEAAGEGGGRILRGDAGLWTTLLAPGLPAPPARSSPPAAATPIGTVGAVGLVAHGAATFAEITYGDAAGALAGRAALLLHDGAVPKLMAFEGEIVDGTAPGTRLQRFTPGGYDWPDTNLVAFYGPVRGGTLPFETQALLLAGEFDVWQLARQYDTLPVPVGMDYLNQFRFPVLAARPDGAVAFAAEVLMVDGTRREVLYLARPGLPNQYEVLLQSGDNFSVATPDGPRTATIRRFNLAQWRPGGFDQLLVSVDLLAADTSAVILVDPTAVAPPRLEFALEGRRLRLRWPESVSASLEATGSLDAGTWTPVDAAITVEGGFRTVEIEPGAGMRFFRLH